MTSTTRGRATRAVGAHAPELVDVEIIELGQGLVNAANAVGDLVVRIGPGGTVGREARRLEAVAARLSIPIPTPRFADEDARLFPGQSPKSSSR